MTTPQRPAQRLVPASPPEGAVRLMGLVEVRCARCDALNLHAQPQVVLSFLCRRCGTHHVGLTPAAPRLQ